jgi:ABC-type bacteriocin/lantibiotic exporter with double-glycine peptidase domain
MRNTDKLVGSYLTSRTRHFQVLLTQYWSLVGFKTIITAAMLIIGSYLLVNQLINVGQFIAADIVIIAIIGSIEKLITTLDSVYDSMVSVEKLSVVTEAETEKSGSVFFNDINKGVAIKFNDVTFAYGDYEPVLKNIDVEIPAGKITHLKGISGAGKSTLLRLLTGAFVNYRGSVLIDGIPVANYNIESLRSNTGILLGSQDIFPGTVWDNITLGNTDVTVDEVRELATLSGLIHFIDSNHEGFDTVIQAVGFKLSSNVRKNILLIRALLGKHRLLLLEEPVDHLEEPYRTNIINYLRRLGNTTTIIASRDEKLSAYCDLVIHLSKQGTIIN